MYQLLNNDLSDKVTLHMNGRFLNNLSFSQDLPLEFLSQLAFTMNTESYTHDDNVIDEGEYGDKIYFIMTGKVAMLHKETHTYLEDLVTDEYFGEIEFFSES